jgi:hypothetical protein
VTTHAAVAAKDAVEQRLQRLPPRTPHPSTLGLAAVKPRPPRTPCQLAVNSMCCVKTVGLTTLLAFVNRRLTWAHPTLHDRIYSSSSAVWFQPKRSSHAERGRQERT